MSIRSISVEVMLRLNSTAKPSRSTRTTLHFRFPISQILSVPSAPIWPTAPVVRRAPQYEMSCVTHGSGALSPSVIKPLTSSFRRPKFRCSKSYIIFSIRAFYLATSRMNFNKDLQEVWVDSSFFATLEYARVEPSRQAKRCGKPMMRPIMHRRAERLLRARADLGAMARRT